jgi:predicted metal-binding membrane protein
MTVSAPIVAVATAGSARGALRRHLARRPETWVEAIAVGAWVVLVVGALASTLGPAPTAGHGHHTGSVAAPSHAGAIAMSTWLAMTVAMMFPVVAPLAGRIAARSLWTRRHRAMATWLTGYVALWAIVGAVVVVAVAALDLGSRTSVATSVALLAAALWQVSTPRRRALARCGTTPVIALRGWAADRDGLLAGARAGVRCAVTCGPAMVATALTHDVALMAAVTLLLVTERARGPNPHRRAGRPREAWGLVACAALAALANGLGWPLFN